MPLPPVASMMHAVQTITAQILPYTTSYKAWAAVAGWIVIAVKIGRVTKRFVLKGIFFFVADCEQYLKDLHQWANRDAPVNGGLAWRLEGGHPVYDGKRSTPMIYVSNVGSDTVQAFRLNYILTRGSGITREQAIESDIPFDPGQTKQISLNLSPNLYGIESTRIYTAWVERSGGRLSYEERGLESHPPPRFLSWRWVDGRLVDLSPFFDLANELRLQIRYNWGPNSLIAYVSCWRPMLHVITWILLATRRRKIKFEIEV